MIELWNESCWHMYALEKETALELIKHSCTESRLMSVSIWSHYNEAQITACQLIFLNIKYTSILNQDTALELPFKWGTYSIGWARRMSDDLTADHKLFRMQSCLQETGRSVLWNPSEAHISQSQWRGFFLFFILPNSLCRTHQVQKGTGCLMSSQLSLRTGLSRGQPWIISTSGAVCVCVSVCKSEWDFIALKTENCMIRSSFEFYYSIYSKGEGYKLMCQCVCAAVCLHVGNLNLYNWSIGVKIIILWASHFIPN